MSEQAAPIFAALGDATRMRIVSRLGGLGPLSIAQLTDGTGMTRQAITKHLHALEEAGLVTSERVGREVRWRVRQEQIDRARHHLDWISQQWDSALERLRKTVEE
jgi:DNA-binding transcriptional ArsR family regulator